MQTWLNISKKFKVLFPSENNFYDGNNAIVDRKRCRNNPEAISGIT